jgi:PncC family amidohydrolase
MNHWREEAYPMSELLNLSRKLKKICLEKKLTIAAAESCTGGGIGAAITAVSGSSQYFYGGVIAYDNSIKISVLGVNEKTLKRYGAVSGQTVRAMALGVKKLMKTSCAVAVSGIAGPGGGTKEKPVGLVYIGISVNSKTVARKYVFGGSRQEVRKQAVKTGIKELLRVIKY